MVDQITDTPLVTRGGASPVIALNFHETLSKPAARAFERFCAIHDGLPGPRRAPRLYRLAVMWLGRIADSQTAMNRARPPTTVEVGDHHVRHREVGWTGSELRRWRARGRDHRH